MHMWPIVTHALEWGLVLSAIVFGLLLLVPFCRPPRIDAPATVEPPPGDKAPSLG